MILQSYLRTLDSYYSQIQATTPRTKTAKYAPYTPKVDLINTGKLIPYIHPMYPFSMAGMQTRRCPTSTATIANPGLNPLVIEVEATWYIEILNASAIQKPSKEGHVHFLSSESDGTGSRSLLDGRPSLPLAKDLGSLCNRKRSRKTGAIVRLSKSCFIIQNSYDRFQRGELRARAWEPGFEKNLPSPLLRDLAERVN